MNFLELTIQKDNQFAPMNIRKVSGAKSPTAHCKRRREDESQEACPRCHKVECHSWKCDPLVHNMSTGASDPVPEESTVVLWDLANEHNHVKLTMLISRYI